MSGQMRDPLFYEQNNIGKFHEKKTHCNGSKVELTNTQAQVPLVGIHLMLLFYA